MERCGHVTGHLTKGKYGRFSKITCFFLRENHGHYCRVTEKSEPRLRAMTTNSLQSSFHWRGKIYRRIEKYFTVVVII